MFNFNNSYLELGDEFYKRINPSIEGSCELIAFNEKLADELNLNDSKLELSQIFSGQRFPEGSEPIALAYSGHQFGHFSPQLGDGRATLIGEHLNESGERFDIQLKGSGKTPYSRRGDGKSPLGPVIREYIMSEAINSLGVKTTRALAAVKTSEEVHREKAYIGGISTRVAQSHIRIGSFEYFSSRSMFNEVRKLADYSINRLYPQLINQNDKYNQFFDLVAKSQVNLVIDWMSLGFIHGVMNTDNILISGETIDYGPCAFMDEFKFDKVFSSIDRNGRYSYHNQSKIILWNLSILANSLFSLLKRDDESEKECIKRLYEKFDELEKFQQRKWIEKMGLKLGLSKPKSSDKSLVFNFLKYLEDNQLDFTNSFRNLNQLKFVDEGIHKNWKARLEEEQKTESETIKLMNSVNPWIIPRNHQVEKAIQDAYEDDLSHFKYINKAFMNPYKENPDYSLLTNLPEDHEIVKNTFCGT